jgi:hypothetical protein
VNADSIVPIASLQATTRLAEATDAAWRRLGGEIINLNRPVRWTEADFAQPLCDALSLLAELRRCRDEMNRLREQAGKDEEAFGSTLEHLTTLENARALLEQDVKIKPSQFHLGKSDLAEARTEIAATTARLDAKRAALAPFEQALHRWVGLVGTAARTDGFRDLLTGDVRSEVVALTESLVAHDAYFRDSGEWMLLHHRLACFEANRDLERKFPKFPPAISDARHSAYAIEERTLAFLQDVPNPFSTADLPTSAQALRKSLEGSSGANRHVVLIRYVAQLYFESLRRIALRGEALEEALASANSAG